MSNRFDITLDRKLDRKLSKAADAAVDVRRIEVITGTGRRRRWSGDDKARILFESLQPGVNVSEVARRHGLSPQQLFAWRNAARTGSLARTSLDAGVAESAEVHEPSEARAKAHERSVDAAVPAFAPVIVAAPAALPAPQTPPARQLAQSGTNTPGTIEITLGDAVVRVSGQVETQLIAAVMRAVRRAS